MINAWSNQTKPKAIYIQSSGDLIKDFSLFEQYNHAVGKEIEMFGSKFDEKAYLEAVFISSIRTSIDQLKSILDTSGKIEDIGIIDKDTQVSLEIELDNNHLGSTLSLAESGVNRLCITINNASVEKLDQKSWQKNSFVFIEEATKLVDTVSLDIVVSSQSMDWLKPWLKKVASLPISHMTISFNEILVCANITKSKFADFFLWFTELLSCHGFYQYELLQFARNLKISYYMNIYSNHLPLKGFGVGAESFDGYVRTTNFSTIHSYCLSIASESDPSEWSERLNNRQLSMEKIIFGMRRIGGAPLAILDQLLAPEEKGKLSEKVFSLEKNEFVKSIGDHLQLTIKGLCFEDEIIAYLMN